MAGLAYGYSRRSCLTVEGRRRPPSPATSLALPVDSGGSHCGAGILAISGRVLWRRGRVRRRVRGSGRGTDRHGSPRVADRSGDLDRFSPGPARAGPVRSVPTSRLVGGRHGGAKVTTGPSRGSSEQTSPRRAEFISTQQLVLWLSGGPCGWRSCWAGGGLAEMEPREGCAEEELHPRYGKEAAGLPLNPGQWIAGVARKIPHGVKQPEGGVAIDRSWMDDSSAAWASKSAELEWLRRGNAVCYASRGSGTRGWHAPTRLCGGCPRRRSSANASQALRRLSLRPGYDEECPHILRRIVPPYLYARE